MENSLVLCTQVKHLTNDTTIPLLGGPVHQEACAKMSTAALLKILSI